VPFGLEGARNLEDDTLEEEIDPSLLPPKPDDGVAGGGAKAKGRNKKAKVDLDLETGESEQLAINLAARSRARRGKLPPVTLLERSGSQQIDRKAVEETGRTLERALAEHGVETRLVGMVVGPTVSRFELELAPARQGQQGHQPPQGHRLRDGDARRAHPGADPGKQADRRRGAQRPPPDRGAGRHPHERGGRGPATRSRWRSAATSTAGRC
jgi:hypothetical protein